MRRAARWAAMYAATFALACWIANDLADQWWTTRYGDRR